MFVIENGYGYQVDNGTGYKISFDVNGQMSIDKSSSISITNQEILDYEEMYKKLNVKASVDALRKQYIITNASSDDYSYFIDRVSTAFKDDICLSKKMDNLIFDVVKRIEGYLDDVVITFDGNGGTGSMPQVRKEVGDKFKLPDCLFIPPSDKRFKEWKIGDTSYDVGDEITLSENITVKAIWEDIPKYTLTFDANGGTGTMEDVVVEVGETIKLPECTFTAPEDKEFSSWLIGEETYDVGDDYTPEDDVTVKATYQDIA